MPGTLDVKGHAPPTLPTPWSLGPLVAATGWSGQREENGVKKNLAAVNQINMKQRNKINMFKKRKKEKRKKIQLPLRCCPCPHPSPMTRSRGTGEWPKSL